MVVNDFFPLPPAPTPHRSCQLLFYHDAEIEALFSRLQVSNKSLSSSQPGPSPSLSDSNVAEDHAVHRLLVLDAVRALVVVLRDSLTTIWDELVENGGIRGTNVEDADVMELGDDEKDDDHGEGKRVPTSLPPLAEDACRYALLAFYLLGDETVASDSEIPTLLHDCLSLAVNIAVEVVGGETEKR